MDVTLKSSGKRLTAIVLTCQLKSSLHHRGLQTPCEELYNIYFLISGFFVGGVGVYFIAEQARVQAVFGARPPHTTELLQQICQTLDQRVKRTSGAQVVTTEPELTCDELGLPLADVRRT